VAALELLEETDSGAFRTTSAGSLLHSGRPGSVASVVRLFTDTMTVRSWEGLATSVRTGEAAFPEYFGKSFFEYLQEHPESAGDFNAAMSEGSHMAAHALPQHYDFGRFATVVDVGGGDGTVLAGALRHNPQLRGVLLDTDQGIARAADVMRQAGVEDRFTAAPGDFFASVPEGGDLYLLKAVLHDWNDEQCIAILRNIRQAMPEGGRLLIVEGVLPARVDPRQVGAYLSDLNMLVNHGGLERTADDFRILCEKAGFTAPSFRRLPLPGEIFLIESAPAGE
jgi:SAM-dependent methyltransferase